MLWWGKESASQTGTQETGLGVTIRWHQACLHEQVPSWVVKAHCSKEILIATQMISGLG